MGGGLEIVDICEISLSEAGVVVCDGGDSCRIAVICVLSLGVKVALSDEVCSSFVAVRDCVEGEWSNCGLSATPLSVHVSLVVSNFAHKLQLAMLRSHHSLLVAHVQRTSRKVVGEFRGPLKTRDIMVLEANARSHIVMGARIRVREAGCRGRLGVRFSDWLPNLLGT